MGKKENPLLEYYNQNGRFAELLNGWLFEGEVHWKAGDIRDADRRQDGKSWDDRAYRHRYRDLYKELRDAQVHLFIGTELQEHVDYVMPLRVMDNDVLSYSRQKDTVSGNYKNQDYKNQDYKNHAGVKSSRRGTGDMDSAKDRRKKALTSDEYLSQFSKSDRLLPVITLVLYCGEKKWDGARCLHELLDFSDIPDKVKKYVSDYPIHILDVCHTPDERLRQFPPDICFLLMCIKYAKDKEAFSRLRELTGTAVVSEDTCGTIAEYLGEPELLKKGSGAEGGRDMCEAIRALVEDGRNEGMREGRREGMQEGIREGRREGMREGRQEGIELAKRVIRMAGAQASTEEIARELAISKEEVERILE